MPSQLPIAPGLALILSGNWSTAEKLKVKDGTSRSKQRVEGHVREGGVNLEGLPITESAKSHRSTSRW